MLYDLKFLAEAPAAGLILVGNWEPLLYLNTELEVHGRRLQLLMWSFNVFNSNSVIVSCLSAIGVSQQILWPKCFVT